MFDEYIGRVGATLLESFDFSGYDVVGNTIYINSTNGDLLQTHAAMYGKQYGGTRKAGYWRHSGIYEVIDKDRGAFRHKISGQIREFSRLR
jgi:hypothetical protein